MSRRPPLPLSPRRLRPRRVLLPEESGRTTPAGSARKVTPSDRSLATANHPHLHQPGYDMISTELLALARRVSGEFGTGSGGSPLAPLSPDHPAEPDICPMFHRGRMYELYSARRNERLRRRRDEKKDWDLGVTGGSEVAKRRVIAKKPPAAAATATKIARKPLAAADASANRATYSLRSSMKKAPTLSYSSSASIATAKAMPRTITGASALITPRRSVGVVEKRAGARSYRRN